MKKEFLWGGALSNVQAEGGYLEDGKECIRPQHHQCAR